MPVKKGFRWYYDTLTPRMAMFTIAANFAITAAVNDMTREIGQWMKDNAPWEDQTGAAREGLTASRTHEGFKQVIYVYHTVDYGIWLEVRWNGRYAIIVPAMEHFNDVMGSGLTGLLGKMSYQTGGSLPAGLTEVGGGADFGGGGEE